MAAAGLLVERVSVTGPDAFKFPSADLAVASWRQLGLVSLLLKGVPEQRKAVAQEEFEQNLRRDFARHAPREWAITGFAESVVTRKPGG